MATIEVGIDTVDGSSDRGVKITTAVVVTCIVAASGGLIFGYDIGISGIFPIQLMLRNSYIYSQKFRFFFHEFIFDHKLFLI